MAREGGKMAKLAKPTLRTSGSSMLITKEQKISLRFPVYFQDTSKRPPGELHDLQIDSQEPSKSCCYRPRNG